MAVANNSFTLLVLVLVVTTSCLSVASQIVPASPGGYRSYIVLLSCGSTPAAAEGGDRDGQLRAWHQTFLPSNLTGEGEPRLITSTDLDMFCALLTDEEAKVVAKKPGVLNAIPEIMMELHTTPGIDL